ncbi:hypothetical protein [Costertonia aggregata]|uniref:Uncharacterized protein n=1 Tax=Costertonia aggregata TaxID=343403 RepID=A0A7H9ATT8_9FLAO|nr:hypothetical protein [Costertonia aggregata]QLG46615.1 hypothetical protein HYG79_15070 [Costertonia aggregata]
MKYILLIVLMMSCLWSCSQSHDITGEYEKVLKSGSVQSLLKLNQNGTFRFDSYSVRQIDGTNLPVNENLPTESSISGKGRYRVKNDVIYFTTDGDTDIDHNYPLNFNDTKAKFKNGYSKNSSNERAIAKLKFFESGIFWIDGLELKKRN